jgi:peptidyl-prolyl cis-trans isomerase-like 3
LSLSRPSFPLFQGGDPTGTGKGGRSIYNTANGKFPDELVEGLKHGKRGMVSMANSGANSNGSQFFITYKAHSHLNGKYTIFGQVIDGHDTLDKMEKQPTGPNDRPLSEIRITRVTIHANPIAV